MKKYLRQFYTIHTNFWKKEHGFSLLLSLVFFGIALVVQRVADRYVGSLQGIAVQDVLLTMLSDTVIIISTLILTFIIIDLFLCKPRYLNIGIKAFSLFIITRSFFISLTHLGSSPHELQFSPDSIGYCLYNILYNTHGDFFFSAHTGVPFLMALVFWPEKRWRIFFLITSGVFGFGVLVAYIHYSIDVFATPFMAYSIFAVTKYFFKRDVVYTTTAVR
jgi:hypothetical protein